MVDVTSEWQFAGAVRKGKAFEIRGVNVWDQGWQVAAGEEAQVNDPVYGKSFIFRVFHIQDDNETIEFAAGEIAPGMWDFTHVSKSRPDAHRM
jgi:hypothetical protein